MQQPVAQIGKQSVSQINLMVVSCVLNTSWGNNVFASPKKRAAKAALDFQTIRICSDYSLPNTLFSCSCTRMKVVRLVSSFSFAAPTYVQVERTPPRMSEIVL